MAPVRKYNFGNLRRPDDVIVVRANRRKTLHVMANYWRKTTGAEARFVYEELKPGLWAIRRADGNRPRRVEIRLRLDEHVADYFGNSTQMARALNAIARDDMLKAVLDD